MQVKLVRQKIKINFAKEGVLRFISHHDIMRLFHRAFRRADIELRRSEGFNPQPRMSFAMPLGLGIESDCEALFVETARWYRPEEVLQRLAAVLPEGMRLTGAELAPSGRGGVYPTEVEYAVPLPSGTDSGALAGKAEELLSRQSIPIERAKKARTKTFDLRPSILDLAVRENELTIRLRVTPKGTARPDEILRALDVPQPVRMRRTALRLTTG